MNLSETRDHERQVAAFMKQAEAENPELFAEVAGRHVVLTDNQLRRRRQIEISAGLIEDGYTANGWGD